MKIPKYKMICVDLDDTLVGRKQQYGAGLKDAIARYVAAGGKFVIVTGRMTVGALPVCRDLDLHGEVLTYQGAVETDIDTEKELKRVALDTDLAINIAEYLEERGVYFQTYREPYFYTQKATERTLFYRSIAHADFVETGCNLSEYLKKERFCPPKILVLGEPCDMPSVRDDLTEKFGDEVLVNISKPFIVEIIPKQINKGKAAAELAARYGIDRKDVICVGDSDNDLTLLSFGGLAVVVGNGSAAAKKAADVIAPDCDDDPITWVIDNLAFEK